MSLIIPLAFVLIGFAAIALILPGFADRTLNRVANRAFAASSEQAQNLYPKLWIADLHCDALLWQRDLTQKHRHGHVDVPRMIEGNVALQVFTVVTSVPAGVNFEQNEDKNNAITFLTLLQRNPVPTWRSLRERALFQGGKMLEYVEKSEGTLRLIRTKTDLQSFIEARAQNPAMAAALLGIEGAQALEGDPEAVDVFFEAGFRLLGLTHFCDNEMAGSGQGMQKGGLTTAGKKLVDRMEQLGMVIDLAHASEKTIDDVLDRAKKPVMVSHTGVRGTCESPRNLSDGHIRRVAQNGGVIGITFFQEALGELSIEAVVAAMQHAADLVGARHLALGSDWDGAIKAAIGIPGLLDLTDTLLQRGFSEHDVELIMGKNAQRVLLEVLPEA